MISSLKLSIFVLLQCLLLCSCYTNDDYKENLFQNYIFKFHKLYQFGSEEYNTRFHNFKKTLKRLEDKNANIELLMQNDYDLAQYGLNMFSDLSSEEFQEKYLSSIQSEKINYFTSALSDSISNSSIPKKLDYRKKSVVTAIKNQESCGGCWAFSSVEVVESAWALKGNHLVPLSTQQVMDCSTNSSGCSGGFPCSAFAWMKKSKAKIVKSSVYPFHDASGKCRNTSGDFGVGVSEYFCKSCQGECSSVETSQMIPKMAMFGPLSVVVNALSWQDYVGGIIQHHCSYDSPNHAVQLVGYDLTGKTPYWIVRNSWGSAFGDNGYLYIKIGENLCGVANVYAGVTKVFS